MLYRNCSSSVADGRLCVASDPKNQMSRSRGFPVIRYSNDRKKTTKKHNKPRPRVAHRGIARFLGIDEKYNQVVPWSLHTFPENFIQIGQAVFW